MFVGKPSELVNKNLRYRQHIDHRLCGFTTKKKSQKYIASWTQLTIVIYLWPPDGTVLKRKLLHPTWKFVPPYLKVSIE